jgi:hypothetical protein
MTAPGLTSSGAVWNPCRSVTQRGPVTCSPVMKLVHVPAGT